MDRVGDEFQEQTKYYPDTRFGGPLDYASQPSRYKEYHDSRIVDLPFVDSCGELSLYDAVRRRKSVRQFCDTPVTLQQLSNLLWASTGITHSQGGYEFRAAPSAGALYPIETYLCVNNVEQLEAGIYHYPVRRHKLELIETGDFGDALSAAALGQDMCAQAAVVFLWTAIFARSKWKYNQRAYRYIYLDAGHIAENLALAATSMNLASCHIAALFDEEANKIIKVDGTEESTIYMTVIGSSK